MTGVSVLGLLAVGGVLAQAGGAVGGALPLGLTFLGLLTLRAFFAGSETALVSLDRARVRQMAADGHKRARIIGRLIDDPDRMLAMTLAGTNLMSVILAQTGLALVIVLLPTAPSAPLIATGMTTLLVLIFGEILPKTIFRLKARDLALRYAYLLRGFDVLLVPVVRAISAITGAIVSLLGRRMAATSPDAVRSELRLLATLGEKSGGIPRDQRLMIHGVLDLRERRVEDVMVPLVNMVAVELTSDLAGLRELAASSGFSRIPVYENRIFNVIGIVHILDVVHAEATEGSLERFVRRDVRFVPESKKVNALLREIQTGPHTMVFAVDEHGGTTGLLTVQDLVEEVFGQLAPVGARAESVRLIGAKMLECDGGTEVETLVEDFGIPVPAGDYETIAGFVLERMGAVPPPGERLETADFVLTVAESDVRAVRRVIIRVKTDTTVPWDESAPSDGKA